MEEGYVAGIPREEQETVINFTWLDDDMTIYTTEQRMMTKLDKLCIEGEYELIEEHKLKGRVVGKTYKADKTLLSLRSKKRNLSEEQREEVRKRFAEMRARS